jgi:hypothetical protein
MAQKHLTMFFRTAALITLAALTGGCARADYRWTTPAVGPVRTEAEAISVAKAALHGSPAAEGPFRASKDPEGNWFVLAGETPDTAVIIDPKSGRASVGGYQSARVDLDL